MTVVIAGCGDLGTEAGLRFADAGHRVLGLRRSPDVLPARFDTQAVDLAREVPVLPTDADIVVLATTADRPTAGAYRTAYVDTLTSVFEGLRRARARPRRVLFVSSTAVYGADDGRWVDETTPAQPELETGRVLVEAESALRQFVPDAIVFRLAGIYGPGRTSLIEQVRCGAAALPDRPRYTNRIHRDDAAAAIVHLTTRVSAPEHIYLGVDDEPVPRFDLLRFLADELGVSHPPPGGRSPARGGNRRCRNARLRSSGFEFTYPTYRTGYRSVLAGTGKRHP